MIYKRLSKILTGAFILAVMFCPAAFAASSLSFGTVTGPSGAPISVGDIQSGNLLEGYWSGVSGSKPVYGDTSVFPMKIADSVGGFTAPSPSDTPATAPSKTFAYKTSGYYFWRYSDDSAPGSAVYIRIWDTSKTYYFYDSFANGAKADAPHTTAIGKDGWYKADAPDTPSITQFDEVSTTVVATGVKSASLKVTSAAGPVTDGMRQITGYSWKFGTDPTSLAVVPGATSPVLSLDSTTLKVGTTYYFQVAYTNWFGSKLSAVQSYTVSGAAGPGGGASTEAWTLYRPLTGVNTIAIPFKGLDSITGIVGATETPGVNIATVGNLIAEINRQVSPAKVTVFGWWDETTQSHMGLTSITAVDGSGKVTAATYTGKGMTSFGDVLALPVKTGRCYQVSVDTDGKIFTIKGVKP